MPAITVPVISQECHPSLLWALASAGPRQVPGDGCQPEVNSQPRELCLDLPGSPAFLGGRGRASRSNASSPERPCGASDHRLGTDQDESFSPLGPESSESDPEGPVQWREPRPRLAVDIDSQLLPECQLHYGLVLAASEESQGTAKDGGQEREQRPNHRPILVAASPNGEPESEPKSDLPSRDEEIRIEKPDQDQRGRILGTHRRRRRPRRRLHARPVRFQPEDATKRSMKEAS